MSKRSEGEAVKVSTDLDSLADRLLAEESWRTLYSNGSFFVIPPKGDPRLYEEAEWVLTPKYRRIPSYVIP